MTETKNEINFVRINDSLRTELGLKNREDIKN